MEEEKEAVDKGERRYGREEGERWRKEGRTERGWEKGREAGGGGREERGVAIHGSPLGEPLHLAFTYAYTRSCDEHQPDAQIGSTLPL